MLDILILNVHILLEELYAEIIKTWNDLDVRFATSFAAVKPGGAVIFGPFATLASLSAARMHYPHEFIIVYDPQVANKPKRRLELFACGINMVAYEAKSILTILKRAVLGIGNSCGTLTCPVCGLSGLTEVELWHHCPAFHVNVPNKQLRSARCPICSICPDEPLQVHIHDRHYPPALMTREVEEVLSGKKSVLYSFSLVICRNPRTGLFLLCHEFSDLGFWLPGGAVDPGESLRAAAVRETLEEAGIQVELKG